MSLKDLFTGQIFCNHLFHLRGNAQVSRAISLHVVGLEIQFQHYKV